MRKLKGIKKGFHLLTKTDKRQLIRSVKNIKRQYGFRGLKKAITNKVNGRYTLENIDPSARTSIGVIVPQIDKLDKTGNEILQLQQKEYTPNEYLSMIKEFKYKPVISIIMPIYNAPIKWLQRAVESLQNQYYDNWELCVVDDGSKDGRGYSFLIDIAKEDARIKVQKNETNRGISYASNNSLENSQGEYIALMDQDDELTKDALFWVINEINEDKEVEFIYTDECKIDQSNTYRGFDFLFKPDWSPSFLINYMYTGHLTVYKKELIKKVGGFRTKYDFSQDYDLVLRISNETNKIKHIERILYFWRTLPTSGAAGGKDYARIGNLAALKDWYENQGIEVIPENHQRGNNVRTIQKTNEKVSIIIPTDSYKNLKQCIQGLLLNTSYSNFEIIPVTNSLLAEKILSEYNYLDNLRICIYDKVYNFSDKCNQGAKYADSNILIFYNDDVIPFTRDWIERQVDILIRTNIGGVSPMLLHEDQTIQYAGMITGTPGLVGTAYNSVHFLNPVNNSINHFVIRNVSVLCGACTVIRKDIFMNVGMFDSANTPNGHSDVDLSFKLLDNGLECVYTPYAILTHIGNHSWAAKSKADKADIYCLKNWGKYLERDAFFTDSMKKMMYNDFEYFYKIYQPKQKAKFSKTGKDILFVTHELSRTGAPFVLIDMVKLCIKNGDYPVIVSPVDGPLRFDYLDLGVTVIVDASATMGSSMFEHFARNFDLVIACTLACAKVVEVLANSLPKVVWWIHEGSYALKHFRHILPEKCSENVSIFCVGEYSKKIIEKKLKGNIELLSYGVSDESDKDTFIKADLPITFLIAGSYEKRKGQDIMAKAIQRLTKECMKKVQFIFVGNVLEENIYLEVKKLEEQFDNITVKKSIPRNELLHLYDKVMCVVSPSRDDPMPVVMTEAMMKRKICICSTGTGTSCYIKNKSNGFVFKNGDDAELAEVIDYIANNSFELQKISSESRKIYDLNFSLEIFNTNVNKYVFKD
jgi:glycosyltransferase involved in cell wall biosynthesis